MPAVPNCPDNGIEPQRRANRTALQGLMVILGAGIFARACGALRSTACARVQPTPAVYADQEPSAPGWKRVARALSVKGVLPSAAYEKGTPKPGIRASDPGPSSGVQHSCAFAVLPLHYGVPEPGGVFGPELNAWRPGFRKGKTAAGPSTTAVESSG